MIINGKRHEGRSRRGTPHRYVLREMGEYVLNRRAKRETAAKGPEGIFHGDLSCGQTLFNQEIHEPSGCCESHRDLGRGGAKRSECPPFPARIVYAGLAEVLDGMRMVAGVGGGVGSSRCEGSAPTVGRAGRMLRGSRTDRHVRPCEHQQGRRRGG